MLKLLALDEIFLLLYFYNKLDRFKTADSLTVVSRQLPTRAEQLVSSLTPKYQPRQK
jgi:hypothetical protein